MSMNLAILLFYIAILETHGIDYRCIINRISKSEAMTLMQNIDLSKKKRIITRYKKFIFKYKNG